VSSVSAQTTGSSRAPSRSVTHGQSDFREGGQQCLDKLKYLKSEIRKIAGFSLPFSAPTFNEVVIKKKGTTGAAILRKLEAKQSWQESTKAASTRRANSY
jgi:hypothetical protein